MLQLARRKWQSERLREVAHLGDHECGLHDVVGIRILQQASQLR
jgi:hypothetical protein